ncbi:hypothetical protein FQN54_001226 [Arachnomyces sp. PD_36]|nr:hypothetical protein FQN54_001226 [Arachnomyces sp. PD_36]
MKRVAVRAWTLADTYSFIALFARRQHSTSETPLRGRPSRRGQDRRRHFHDYFVTHLPSSSLHPDSRAPPPGPHHRLPRSASTPHTPGENAGRPSPATMPPNMGLSRETTVVRIPLRSAKHHFGVSLSRGSRPANEDSYQAGVIELPAFAKRAPLSYTIGRHNGSREEDDENRAADSASGDPQVFYFGVFDGHGGTECSGFLRDSLHEYVQNAADEFELKSSLGNGGLKEPDAQEGDEASASDVGEGEGTGQSPGDLPIIQEGNRTKIAELEETLVTGWRDLVGGYFRRFRPTHFAFSGENRPGVGQSNDGCEVGTDSGIPVEEVMEYAFLRADLDFVSAQASKDDEDLVQAEKPLNESDVLHNPSISTKPIIGGRKRFKGGSTCSVAMISTPTPTPFWHPATPCSMLISHVGDTRILLCSTKTGMATPLTTNHHPSSPVESTRLRKYASSFTTDSFGEERMSGLANTRAFGDIQFKRIGVSAEPEIRRVELGPAEYSFMVLMSDGVSGTLTDQEVVDIIKEAKTPDQGAKDVVSFATEVTRDGDNATCLAVRLGGWERRQEGGLGSMGTKESRDWRKKEATTPRNRRA